MNKPTPWREHTTPNKGNAQPRRANKIGTIVWVSIIFVLAFVVTDKTLDYTTPAAVIKSHMITGRASVIDGDTIEIHGRRIRLAGIDSPESAQYCAREGKGWLCGKDAAFALADLIDGKLVQCNPAGLDQYKRTIATCYQGKIQLNRWMVAQGWALDFERYSHGRYADAQAEAKGAERGLWQGSFIPPWDWRRLKRGKRQTGS